MDYIGSNNDKQHVVCEGDVCVIYISDNSQFMLKIEADKEKQTKFGLIKMNDLINHPYGHKFDCKRGWILPLRLTPELWTANLTHRTQILYQADISMILLQLDVKPGSIVIEAGTGSGSLSHAIIRACRPHGLLYTYEINESRFKSAREEFKEHGLDSNVLITHRDICEQGCGDEFKGFADACILDLPQTWNAIEHVNKVLKNNGSRLCTFSPCVEQVKLNVAKMTELKFKDIITMEVLMRPFTVQEEKLRLWTDEILEELKLADDRRMNYLQNKLNPAKRAKIFQDNNISDSPMDIVANDKFQLHQVEDSESRTNNSIPVNSIMDDESATHHPKASFTPSMLPTSSFYHAKQFQENVSHSGYLTFATKRT